MKQPSLAHVLQPKWRTALQRLREERANGGSGKLVVLALVGGAFWVGVFGVLHRSLKALPAVLGSAVTLILVNIFPARRTRDLLSIIALGAAGGVILLFRLIRPEQLARPEGFRNLLDFVILLRGPTSPFLPSEWASQAIMGYLRHEIDLSPLILLWTTAAAFVTVGALLHRVLYPTGFTKAQEGAERFIRGSFWRWTVGSMLGWLPVAKREFVLKDIKLFFRDTTQWSQLILLAVLVVVYLFNIQALPLHRGEPVGFFYVNLVSFLNLGLAGFVLASIAARFIFPAVSLEGRQMWLLRSSPLDLRALLWSKYWVGTVPLLVLALLLTGVTNVLLQVSSFMMIVSLATICALTLAISALALGYGALYPQFETENAAQIPTSFGGLVFMMTTIALLGGVIVALWQAVYAYVRAVYQGRPVVVDGWMISWFAVAAERRARQAGIEFRGRHQRPAPPHRQVQLAPHEHVVGVEVVAHPGADCRPVDQHRPAASDPTLPLCRRAYGDQSRDHHPDPQCETGHTDAP